MRSLEGTSRAFAFDDRFARCQGRHGVPPSVKRIVYVSASSGGGHDGTARALVESGRRLFGGDAHQEIIDFYGGGVLRGLPFLARVRYHLNWFWWLFLTLTDSRLVTRTLAALLRPFAVRFLRRQIGARPDVLVAVHF